MKKKILLLAIGAFLLSIKSEAQHFVASFGAQVEWGVPNRVEYTIGHDYYGYNWVHATRTVRNGYTYFDVLLQRGDVFVEVNVGHNGRIMGRTYFDYYPLNGHVCNGYCGYHANYYASHRVACNSHHHHGHNHVVYKSAYTQVYHAPKGHAHGYHKKHYNHKNRVVYTRNTEPVRRGRYYNDARNRQDRDHGKGHYKARSKDRNEYNKRSERSNSREYNSRPSRARAH